MARTLVVAACCFCFTFACSDSGAPTTPRLQAVGGVLDDGSGRPGLALLATLRGDDGSGPSAQWSGTVRDPRGTVVGRPVYDAAGPGSFALWSWAAGGSGAASGYVLELSSGEGLVRAAFDVPSPGALDIPRPGVTTDGALVVWDAIPGAATYACRMAGADGAVLDALGMDPACDVSALPPGAYEVTAVATSLDLLALSADTAPSPAVPASFEVTEARLGLLRRDALPAIALRAAGGAIDWNAHGRTLAVWVSVADAGGTSTAADWDVTVTGPGLPTDAPLAFRIPAAAPRLLVWSYGVPAAPGAYAVRATSSLGTVATRFTIGEPAPLPLPTDVVATAGAQGAVRVDWPDVAGARAYFVSVYTEPTETDPTAHYVAGQWVATAAADWPQDTFTPGSVYQVYVAAADADMLGGEVPFQVSVAEDAWTPAHFVAR